MNLARTTLRNIIGTLTLKSANSERDKINGALLTTLSKETTHWGMEIVRTELIEIDPPKDVQETMNKVVKAENEKADDPYFVGNAQLLRKLEALEKSLSTNAKIVIPSGSELINVIGDMSGVIPLTKALSQTGDQSRAAAMASSFGTL